MAQPITFERFSELTFLRYRWLAVPPGVVVMLHSGSIFLVGKPKKSDGTGPAQSSRCHHLEKKSAPLRRSDGDPVAIDV